MTSSVLAHDPGGPERDHTHPVLEVIPAQDNNEDNDTTDPGEGEVALHGVHPTVTIALKAGQANVRGNRVAVVADDDTTTDVMENQFTLLVTFNVDVTNTASQTSIAAGFTDIANGDLASDEFTFSLLDRINVAATNPATLAIVRVNDGANTPAIVAAGKKQFEVVVTIPDTEVPSGTADANDESLTFRIRVDAGSVFALQEAHLGPNGVDPVNVPGGGNLQSEILELTLVNDLGADPADSVEAVVSTITSGAINADGEVDFTITFNKALIATQTFRLGDITIAGGRAVNFVPNADGMTFVLTVMADARTAPITVTAGGMTQTSDPEMVSPDIPDLVLRIAAPTAPNADGDLVFTITSNQDLTPNLTIHDFDIDTREVEELASGDLVMDTGTLPDGIAERYTLTVTPKAGVTSVLVELRAGASMFMHDHDDDPATDRRSTPTPTREALYTPETGKPTITITAMNLDDSGLAAEPGDIDSIDGGRITITAMDTIDGNLTSQIADGEVTVSGGAKSGFAGGVFTVTPTRGATSVTVTVAANAVRDNAGNGNDAKSMKFSVGPIFNIPANTILVITKTQTPSSTYMYLSDEPRLPINQDPPTPADDFTVDTWHNMPDLEVLFSRSGGSNGGTLNLIEADGQAELPQTRDGDKNQKNSVRISEVMWAADESQRGGTDDAEAAEQWIEISNYTSAAVRVFLYARTGLESAIHTDGNAEDRVGNAYNGVVGNPGWNVPGSSGDSYTGKDFVSMHRSYVGGDNRGYVRGTDAGHWKASERIYRTNPTGNPNDGALYHYKGSPGRRDAINLPTPDQKKGTTVIPGGAVSESEKVLINEVANRSNADADYEWIELRNYGNAVADLRNFRVSMVTATGTDKELFRFAHNDAARIPVGGVLLVVASDPRYDDDHPIAVGKNVALNDADQVAGLGLIVKDANGNSRRAPALYRVLTFQNGGLPDNGEFVLIVRSPDNHENKNEGGKGWAELGTADLDKISDIAGYHPNLVGPDNYPSSNPPNLNKTNLWPLVNFGAPNLGHNKLEVNRVHRRQKDNTPKPNANSWGIGWDHDNRAAGRAAFADAGYSGIGYKRTARNLIEHRGTPGYHGNVVNNKAGSSVMISEVMYSTGANETLPQWIELYNSSATKAVHLGSGWRIRIETLDASGKALTNLLTISFKDKGRVKYIYPQQTVLVAAGNARQAGSDFQPASIVFPENRLFNVFRDIGNGELKSGDEFKNNQYMFFNPKAFHLALLDKDGALVDEIGNLDGDVRTNDTVTADEEFPSAVGENGMRTSIIRIYDDGVARDGMKGVVPIGHKRLNKHPDYAWVPAVNTDTEFKITIRSTWYGDEDDYGTPGHRRGLVLPVELSSFRPTLEDGVVTVRWTTESELDNAGFNIYRSETRDGEFKQVNSELIEGAGTTGERSNYSWVDQTAKPGVVYYYQIEDVSFAGDRQPLMITKLKGLISAKNKLTTTWSELKEASQ